MNTLSSLLSGARGNSRRGVALIVVLGSLIFLSALMLAFLSSVKTELVVSKAYADNNAIGSLVNSSVNIVMGQVRQATTASPTNCWTSQPGLIRTFNVSGAADQSYKLYSSDVMQVNGALDPLAEAAALAQWAQQTAVYTDLNQPSSGSFPILDPTASGPVQGFSVTGAPTTATQSIPMPAKWLYVLKDGTLAAPDDPGAASTTTATFNNSTNKPAAGNPIVGRIAFWTDDETCKVNVNTASEGTYWDMPRGSSPSEKDLGMYQPASYEFQSYPGHPASTSLSPVFPELTREQIFSLVPRLENGGSENASLKVNVAKAVTLDPDRLYATPDEIVFANDRTNNASVGQALTERGKFFVTTASRAPETNLFGKPKVVCWPVHATNNIDYRTPFDRLFAFCGELKGKAYYFQRKNADSTTEDYDGIPRNKELFKYLHDLTDGPIPGFGGNFASKYQADKDQILTEIFDYIRCTNLIDGNLAIDKRYAAGKEVNGTGNGWVGFGQVLPIEITDYATRGFGRVPVITEVGFWIICTGDAKVPTPIISNDPATNKTLDTGVALTFDNTKKTKQMRIEAALVFEPFVPLAGYKDITPDIEVKISGLETWKIRGNAAGDTDKTLGFPPISDQDYTKKGRYLMSRSMTSTHGSVSPRAGHTGIWSALGERGIRARNNGRLTEDPVFSQSSASGGTLLNQQYPFVGEPVTVDVDTTSNTAARLVLTANPIIITVTHRPSGKVIQTYQVDFPATVQLPTPALGFQSTNYKPGWTFQATGSCGLVGRFKDIGLYPFTQDGYAQTGGISSFGYGDVVRSIVPAFEKSGAKQSADFRLLAMKSQINNTDFSKHPFYDTTRMVANSFVQQSDGYYWHLTHRNFSTTVSALGGDSTNLAKATGNYGVSTQATDRHPDTSFPATVAQATGDWDNGVGLDIDGPYLNKPDEGITYNKLDVTTSNYIPYLSTWQQSAFDTTNFFSPNRIIPSPAMFGSLPTGVKRDLHWQTLLFRRQPGHPNYPVASGLFTQDPDYLWLDFFWMPVVEPYAISEPLSTAGKINLNQQIIPFTWIDRSTGMHALLKNEKVISFPNSEISKYKSDSAANFRRPIKIPETLSQLKFRFDNSDGTGLFAFRTPAEICDMHIIPDDASPSTVSKTALDTDMAAYWGTHALTGDNSRERIYTTLYSRLTTRSNTFRIHYRVQTLKKLPNSAVDQWSEVGDLVTGEGRGSVLVERFIDPNDSTLPDYGANPAATSLESHYQFRVLSVKRFDP